MMVQMNILTILRGNKRKDENKNKCAAYTKTWSEKLPPSQKLSQRFSVIFPDYPYSPSLSSALLTPSSRFPESNSISWHLSSSTIIEARANRSGVHRDTRRSFRAIHPRIRVRAGCTSAQESTRCSRGRRGIKPRRRSHPIYYVQDHCTTVSRARVTSARLFARAWSTVEIGWICQWARYRGVVICTIRQIMCPIQEAD